MAKIKQTTSSEPLKKFSNHHFIFRIKDKYKGDKFYFYKGQNFKMSEYKLLLMAKYFPDENEIRIYSINDLDSSNIAYLSSDHRFKKESSTRIDPESKIPFDYENGHFAKICIINPANPTAEGAAKEFVIKSRWCSECS